MWGDACLCVCVYKQEQVKFHCGKMNPIYSDNDC